MIKELNAIKNTPYEIILRLSPKIKIGFILWVSMNNLKQMDSVKKF